MALSKSKEQNEVAGKGRVEAWKEFNREKPPTFRTAVTQTGKRDKKSVRGNPRQSAFRREGKEGNLRKKHTSIPGGKGLPGGQKKTHQYLVKGIFPGTVKCSYVGELWSDQQSAAGKWAC